MNDTITRPVCLWSGPRNVSTALMYSFAQLPAVRVVDEPLYAHYLRVSGADHPGRNAVLSAQQDDGEMVMQQLLREQAGDPSTRLFLKHMAHHLIALDHAFLDSTFNVFLVRDPREMLPSLRKQLPNATLADTGLKQQWELYSELSATGQSPTVVDSRQLLLNPAVILKKLCDRVGLKYEDAMLHWDKGPRPEDGVWAPHWYHAVHQSTGFAPYTAKTGFPVQLEQLLLECQPWYDRLYKYALRADAAGENQ